MSDEKKRPRPGATSGKPREAGGTRRRAARPPGAAPEAKQPTARGSRDGAAAGRSAKPPPATDRPGVEALTTEAASERSRSSTPPSIRAISSSPAPAPRIVEVGDDDDPGDDDGFYAAEAEAGDGTGELGIGSRMIAPDANYASDSEDTEARSRRDAAYGSPEEVEAQIRALEARLDGMIRRASDDDVPSPASVREQVESAAREVIDRIASAERALDRDPEHSEAHDLLSSDYYHRQWGRLGVRSRTEDVDEFGLDPSFEQRLRPLLEFAYRRYFRAETTGVEHIPEAGRCLIVANHSGTLPIDGAMLRTAVRLEHSAARELRWLAEDFVYYLPFVGTWMNRVGAVRACQENAERLLAEEALVAVFPEGVKGIGKLYRDRYRLQRFGRGGFIRLALRTQTPLVPCAVIGAEEMNPMLYRVDYLAKAIGVPYLPVTPTFPWFGPAGLVPAPTKWRIVFGEPLHFDGYGPEAAEDHVLVARLSERVRGAIQTMLDSAVKQRKSVWR